jgi:hypothetical protein
MRILLGESSCVISSTQVADAGSWEENTPALLYTGEPNNRTTVLRVARRKGRR